MCTGEERLQMLREAYRLGYNSGKADGMEEAATGQPPDTSNIVDFEAAIAERWRRRESG